MINVQEHSQVFAQSVTNSSELQYVEILAHRDILHAVLFRDFDNNYELIKYDELNKCHLSVLDEDGRQQRITNLLLKSKSTDEYKPQEVHNTESIEKFEVVRLEHQPALTNTSHLREEFQLACKGMPIFWADKIPKKQFDQTIGIDVVNGSTILSLRSSRNQVNCDIIDPGLPWAHCRSQCLSYVVKPAPGQRPCHYRNACPHHSYVPSGCIQRVESVDGIRYILCCRDGNAPRCPGTFYQHCSCVT